MMNCLIFYYYCIVHRCMEIYNYLEMAFHLIIGQSIHLHQLADLLRGRHFYKQETNFSFICL